MTMPTFPPTLPILGQPFKIKISYSTAIIECQCDGRSLLMLPGLSAAVQCPACGNVYAIAKAGEVAVGQLRNRAMVS